MFDKQDASLFNEGSFSPNIIDKNPHSAFIRNQLHENRTNDNTLIEGNCDGNQTTLTNIGVQKASENPVLDNMHIVSERSQMTEGSRS